jgi:alkanesulfonate monooxygenase SsuD/methylene tetrahydromethanopterin reductase-like flavin-dependent oxidoreductase (luciferase family)
MYADEIAAVLGYLGADPGWLGSLAGFMPSPWLLASSESGVRLAARFGLPLSFVHHIDPAGTESALALYRSEFRPSWWLDRPYAMLGVTTICADTDERANELARPFEVLLTQFPRGSPRRFFPCRRPRNTSSPANRRRACRPPGRPGRRLPRHRR